MSKFIVVEPFTTEEFPSYEEALSLASDCHQADEEVAIYEVTKKYLPTTVVFKEEKL